MIAAIIAAMVGTFLIERFAPSGVAGQLAFFVLMVALILLLGRAAETDPASPSHR